MQQVEKDVLEIMKNITNRVALPGKGNQWINLADLGGELRKNGIDYGKLGYDKLTSFLKSLNIVEFYRDLSKTLPVIFIRESNNTQQSFSSPREQLMNWAFMGYFPTTFKRLKEMALEEDWGTIQNARGEMVYPTNEKGEEIYPILNNYLTYTFYKLHKEEKILISPNKEYASFNTGLVDSRYKPIYALFKKNRDPQKKVKWYWVDFCIEGEERVGKTLVDQFRDMPPRAHYFNKVSDMLYDTSMGTPSLDLRHIIIERVDRLPFEFIQDNAPRTFEVKDTNSMSGEERYEYYDSLRQAIEKDQISQRQMTSRIEDALSISFERVKWNFKSAIPMYYPKKDKMCLFLPLCLVKDNRVDVALVVEKTSSGRYQGATIYKLDWAYKCARLVCRPDSDWLTTAATNNKGQNDLDDID